MRKRILVNGAGGFIGGHLVERLKAEGLWVRAVDLKEHEYAKSKADEFIIGDLRDPRVVSEVMNGIEEVYQLAADMGGAGYIFTGEHDAAVMRNSATINLNILEFGNQAGVKRFFYSSSACIYPEYNQLDPHNPKCDEDSAYPAAPDSEYGWEKFFSERLFLAYQRNRHRSGYRILELPVNHRLRVAGVTQVYKWKKMPGIFFKHVAALFQIRSETANTGIRRVPAPDAESLQPRGLGSGR